MRGQPRVAGARERALVPRIPMAGHHGVSSIVMAGTSLDKFGHGDVDSLIPACAVVLSRDRV
jgi:hypothetical protein